MLTACKQSVASAYLHDKNCKFTFIEETADEERTNLMDTQ